MPDIPVADEVLFDWLVIKPLEILAVIVISIIVRWISHRLINRFTSRPSKKLKFFSELKSTEYLAKLKPETSERREQRSKAMATLLKSVASVVIGITAFAMILQILGLPIAPLLASAGVFGLAIGFGAQSVVKDVLSGIALILEDQYGVGDVIEVNQVTGTVESVGMRVTQIRDFAGTVWYIRNGEILQVGNQSQNWTQSVLEVTISKWANVDLAIELLKEVVNSIATDAAFEKDLLESPNVVGVDRFNADGVVLQIRFKTEPEAQWEVSRALRERIKTKFDEQHIALVTSSLSTSRGAGL